MGTKSSTNITAVDYGPIKRFSCEVPKGGGVVVLQGRNGIGKSALLDGIQTRLDGKGAPPVQVRDGAVKGEVEAFGGILRIGNKTNHLGELEFTTLEGRLHPSDIVDPNLKDEEAAEAKRIKALCGVCCRTIDAKPWHDLVGGQAMFDQICPGAVDRSDGDVLALAGYVTRGLNAKAHTLEVQTAEEEKHIAALREAIGDVDVHGESDPTKLQQALQAAMTKEAELKGRQAAARDTSANAEAGRKSLADAEAGQADLPVDKARERVKASIKRLADNDNAVLQAKAGLERAQEQLRTIEKARLESLSAKELAEGKLAAAIERDNLIASLRVSLKSAEGVTAPNPLDIDIAVQAVTKARLALENGRLIRDAQEKVKRREKHKENALEYTRLALEYREKAAATDGILSELVQKLGTDLRIVKGKVMCTTDRGDTRFSELSHGEKWKRVIDLVADVLGEDGVFVIPQEAWEGLDPTNREAVVEHCHSRGVTAATAESTEDEEMTSVLL